MKKRFIILLIGGGDTFISLVDSQIGDKIEGDNDKALKAMKKDVSFDSVRDLIDHVRANSIEITGEFHGYAY